MNLFYFIVLFFFFKKVLSNNSTSNDICLSKTTCSECIQSSKNCVWCKTEKFLYSRCDLLENLINKKCFEEDIVDEEMNFSILKNFLYKETDEEDEENYYTIQPQEIFLSLRKQQKKKFKIKYRQMIDHPVDLYYLMDLSFTMKDDKTTLANLGNTLANQMKEITKDFRLGFGSFVDKTMMPYVNTHPSSLKTPCLGCAPPYSFRNHISLTQNTEIFSKEVKNSQISGNLDGPEGGLDAIIQAIVCEKKIGWRSNARKLLVYTTDATYHQAGDGRLAGLYSPNDLKCHLDNYGYYNKSNYQDYPSLNQISQIIKKHQVNIIFAVTSSKIDLYKELTKLIKGSSTAALNSDSSNVVDLIKEEYKKITTSVTLHDNSTSNFKINYESKCLGENLKETQFCTGLSVGSEVEFEINLELLSCPKLKNNYNQVIKISPIGIQEGIIIKTKLICDCECENESYFVGTKDVCSNGNGVLKCGLCDCDTNHYGKFCECKIDENYSIDNINNKKGCLKTQNETKVCSGNGQCSCNTCFCNEPYTGKYCECDPFSCERFNNLICGGHGFCNCGTCECDDKWTGSSCQCPSTNETCIDPFNQLMCNNQGDCFCGKCHCNTDETSSFSGKFCQKCSNCIDKICQALYIDIEKQITQKIRVLENINFTSYLVENFEINTNNEIINHSEKIFSNSDHQLETCEFLGKNSCLYTFKYKQKINGFLIVYVLKKSKCSQKADIKKTATSVILGVLLTGIITLIIWKLITYYYDKHEYEAFEKQVKNAIWNSGQNPLYKPSISKFNNPSYHSNEINSKKNDKLEQNS